MNLLGVLDAFPRLPSLSLSLSVSDVVFDDLCATDVSEKLSVDRLTHTSVELHGLDSLSLQPAANVWHLNISTD